MFRDGMLVSGQIVHYYVNERRHETNYYTTVIEGVFNHNDISKSTAFPVYLHEFTYECNGGCQVHEITDQSSNYQVLSHKDTVCPQIAGSY